ncbi:methyltransferase domain-containing protein [Populibacterium corticicola]|uniref:Methyltransferase domain-containing protein n=1 Tax=Populibacterium corticicola TaxID=1812826 RepID=A0ABW5XHH1_9MICO
MQCHHFDAGTCGSCTLLRTPYSQQLADKVAHAQNLLHDYPDLEWLPAVPSAESGFRNKAKMVVTGTWEAPVLGILDGEQNGVDLHDCPLYDNDMKVLLEDLRAFITTARVQPYDLRTRRGELKYVLVMQSPDGEYLVRFVSRSREPETRLRKHLPALLAVRPDIAVFTLNIQPEHKAVLEGDLEIFLTERETLTMRVGGVPLNLRPQSFFQTNTPIAEALYAQARDWIADESPALAWDLFCGVGGFALHMAPYAGHVVGIEIAPDAIASAKTTAAELGITNLSFDAMDATAFAVAEPSEPTGPDGAAGTASTSPAGTERGAGPQVIVVNPPRRGIGTELAQWLEASSANVVVYSSCNAITLAKDLAHMPSLKPVEARVLDMFPHTSHYEVIVLLKRAS